MIRFLILLLTLFIQMTGYLPAEEQATPADQIKIAKDFEVDLVYSVAPSEQGSWVCMALDQKGRFIFSDQRGPLYRMTLAANGAKPNVERLHAEIGQAHGLLYAFDSLYVTVNGDAANGTGVYRLQDTNDDDQFDRIEQLIGFGKANSKTKFKDLKLRIQNLLISSGHGPHGIVKGPDGYLYLVGGNHAVVPGNVDLDSPFRNWNEDLLLPRIPDSQGIATGIMAPGGWVMRFDKDGTNWQLICGGLRNPYDLAFNSDEELFTFDSDMEFDAGMPWYIPCQINHIVSAGEYGWRYGSGKWPDYFVDSVGSVVDVGLASPAGLTFGYEANFPERYRKALFVTDWAYGKIMAVHLSPSSSSYSGSFELFASGKPLAVVDLLVHPDGNLYFLTGGRKSVSGLYRIRYTGSLSESGDELEIGAEAKKFRELRRQLEQFHSNRHNKAANEVIELAWPMLAHEDRFIRYAARVAVERQPVSKWKARFANESRRDAVIQGAVALARNGGTDDRLTIILKLLDLPFHSLAEYQQLDTLRAMSLTLSRFPGIDDEDRNRIADRLGKQFPNESRHVNRELSRLLVHLESEKAVEKIVGAMKETTIQEDQIFYGFVLRLAKVGWTQESQTQYFEWLAQVYNRYQGGSGFEGFVRRILSDVNRRLTKTDRKLLREFVKKKKQVSKVELPRQFVNNWQPDQIKPLLHSLGVRSFESGKSAFRAAQCNKCHRIAGSGGSTGPDLTGVGNRFSREYLLDAILHPSKVIPDQYQNSKFLLKDGEQLVGRIVARHQDVLEIRTNPYSTNTRRLNRDQIELLSSSTLSEMPTGLINVLSEKEILDLLAYMIAGGVPDDSIFEKPNQ